MLSDVEIAQAITPRPIQDIAARLDVGEDHLVPFGRNKAKLDLALLDRPRKSSKRSKLVLVSAITPTRAGEGKTTTTIGLGQALDRLGESVCLALREPSLGPCMGVKGGACGGGYSQVIPMESINLHFTGDLHAITAAHNLLAAALDNKMHFRDPIDFDPRRVSWRRAIDMNDRSLRSCVIGLSGDGVPRESGFDITAASEVMAVLCLAQGRDDLRKRLDRMVVAWDRRANPIEAKAIGVTGAMLALLDEAMMPNLVQTLEGTPAIIHGGPFANIAHGCNSVLATRMAMHLSDWTITEAGFGFDLGAEKFFDIKCRSAGLEPDAVVLVATIRALKLHGGVAYADLEKPNPEAVAGGLANLEKHVESCHAFGHVPVVALNRFHSDVDAEIAVVRERCQKLEVPFAESDHFARGGEGAEALAKTLIAHCAGPRPSYRPLYELGAPLVEKVKTVATKIYGANEIIFSAGAKRSLKRFEEHGYGELPICIAKTQSSLSDDPKLLGRPEGFALTVRDLALSAGAGFVVVLTGEIMRMPGLPKRPSAEHIDVVNGRITGLS
ncbi:MAG: formate--tetrahydrofolate ligase [Polyangiaceae bacterium]